MLNKVSCLFSADFGLESLFKVYLFLSCFLHVCLCNTLFENSPGESLEVSPENDARWNSQGVYMCGKVRKSSQNQHLMEVCGLSTLYYIKLDNRVNI